MNDPHLFRRGVASPQRACAFTGAIARFDPKAEDNAHARVFGVAPSLRGSRQTLERCAKPKGATVMIIARLLACFAFGATAMVLGCSSSSPSQAASGTTVACSFTTGDVPECYDYTNLTTSEVTNAKALCTASNATFVASCPTTALLGCCHQTMAGISLADCYYDILDDAGGPPTFQANCMQSGGTWSTTP